MSKEKQIEEMARELIIVKDKDGQINFPKTAEHLYIRGFRMQSNDGFLHIIARDAAQK